MQFKVYAILSGNGFVKLFIFSTFSTLLVALGAWLLKKVDPLDESPWSDQLFKAYSLLNNVCGASAVDEDKPSLALVANVLFMTGCLTFAILLGLVTSTIENSLENALAGTHRVVAKHHVVMLNWSEKSPAMLRQMQAAVEDGRIAPSTPVVILAQKDKAEMDEEVAEAISTSKLSVHTRTGNPAVFSDLELASAGDAKHIILVAPDEPDVDASETVLIQVSFSPSLSLSHTNTHVCTHTHSTPRERGCFQNHICMTRFL